MSSQGVLRMDVGEGSRAEGLTRMFKSYHPRENELYREVDDDYRAVAASLKAELLRKLQAVLGVQSD